MYSVLRRSVVVFVCASRKSFVCNPGALIRPFLVLPSLAFMHSSGISSGSPYSFGIVTIQEAQ